MTVVAGWLNPLPPVFDGLEAWVAAADVQRINGILCLSLLVGFGLAWVWQKLR